MTERQKNAIGVLNGLLKGNAISDEEYFLLLEFIMVDRQMQYIPYPITTPDIKPYYDTNRVTCTTTSKDYGNDKKE